MAEKFSITIARQCGSHGRSVAKKIAEKLGIDYYDKELISLASKKSGINEKVFENFDEKPTNSLLYSLAMGAYAMIPLYLSPIRSTISSPILSAVLQPKNHAFSSAAVQTMRSETNLAACTFSLPTFFPPVLRITWRKIK